ncbi:MAG: hypothetical protein HC882_07005 [Acidobacteria bacterium]|nr:hypothetical protein [Acidobacteriota bacterium]
MIKTSLKWFEEDGTEVDFYLLRDLPLGFFHKGMKLNLEKLPELKQVEKDLEVEFADVHQMVVDYVEATFTEEFTYVDVWLKKQCSHCGAIG